MMESFFNDHMGLMMGILFIAVGILARCFPRFTNLYSYRSAENRSHIDLKGLGRHLLFGFGILGCLLIGSDFLPLSDTIVSPVRLILLFIGMLVVLGTTQRYDHNQ